MNKADLVRKIAEDAEIPLGAAAKAFQAVQNGIIASLKQKEPIVLVGFCTITVQERAAREGRNPSTGEKIKIKAANVVRFKAGKDLKEAVKRDDN